MSELSATDKLAVLGRATHLLAAATDFKETLSSTIAACLPALGDFGFFDVVIEGTPMDGVIVRTARAHEDPRIDAILAPTQWVRNERKDLNLCALSSGSAGLHSDIDDAWYRVVAVNEGHLAVLRDLAFCSMLTVPMRYRDELVGSLTLFYGRSGRQHSEDQRAFAQDLAALAAPVVVNARLVEQHRRAEEALRRSEERLRLAAEAGELGLWDWDIVDDRVTWSERVYDLHGLARGEFGGSVRDFAELVHPEDRERVDGVIQRALETGETYAVEFRAPRPDGTTRWLAARANILHDTRGAPVRMLGATFDVTERVELLAAERAVRAQAEAASAEAVAARIEAERARAEAEAASRAKDEFLAILGHELRNPLAPIVSALELMRLREDSTFQRERDIITRQVTHLSRLVDDLLDVSRIVRGKVELTPRPTNLVSVVEKAVEMSRPLFEQRTVTLTQSSTSCWVNADPVRLAQVVGNLLTNAAKFTPPGGRVELSVHADKEIAELVVADNGKGIAGELLPDIFGLFVQGPQELDRSQGGLGLGLAIVSNLVSLHGGTVQADSPGPGHGSTFRVRLPRITGPGDAASTSTEVSVRPESVPPPQVTGEPAPHLLLVDDNVDSAELLAELLRTRGYAVTVEMSASDALRAAQRVRPDIAILDIGLPGMNGYELARALRAVHSMADLRLVALTGYGRETDREQARAAGFDHHLVKPVSPALLFSTVEDLLRT